MKQKKPGFDPYEGKDPYIFVSYSHKDKEVIADLEVLSKLGFRIWYDDGIKASVDWAKSIDKHVKDCSALVIFVSINAVNSPFVISEWGMANRKKIPVLPIVLNNEEDFGVHYGALLILEGVMRWEYDKRKDDYYSDLCKKIESIAPQTRADAYDRDSKTLGLGYLPTIKDVICKDKYEDEISLTTEELEQRRENFVSKIRKTPKSYLIENVFQITSKATNALNKLADYEIHNTNSDKPTNLLKLPLDIEKVYIAPMRLVTGLITRLDENWPPLVASYKKLVKPSQKDRLDELHYYIEFCWLAWGPSVLTSTLNDKKNKFIVVQAAFGDEANSIPLIMKNARWDLIEDEPNKKYYGWPVSLKNILAVRPGADEFFREIRSEGHLFEDMFSDAKQVALYLPYNDNGYADGEINSITDAQEAFYSTAYVWLMLEQISKDEIEFEGIRPNPMKPGKVIPFFEHANLATNKGLDFLQHCLARKAIYHILDCESEPNYSENGYYCFATALFPKRMIEILKEEIDRLNENDQNTLKKRFKIPEEKFWRTPKEVVKFADSVGEAVEDCCLELIVKSEDCKLCDKYETCEERKLKELSMANADT